MIGRIHRGNGFRLLGGWLRLGLVFGSGLATAGYLHTIGSEAAPVKVSGTLACGENTLAANAENFHNCLNGNKCGNNLVNGFDKVVYHAVYEVVTK